MDTTSSPVRRPRPSTRLSFRSVSHRATSLRCRYVPHCEQAYPGQSSSATPGALWRRQSAHKYDDDGGGADHEREDEAGDAGTEDGDDYSDADGDECGDEDADGGEYEYYDEGDEDYGDDENTDPAGRPAGGEPVPPAGVTYTRPMLPPVRARTLSIDLLRSQVGSSRPRWL